MQKTGADQPPRAPATNNAKPFSREYVALVALLVSIAALGTDLMLPALTMIGSDLQVSNANEVHNIVTSFFLGMALGQIIVGPLSDWYGRKPIIYLGYLFFVAGCVLSVFATNWTLMMLGRVLQGVGAAAPRVVTMAMVRDEYKGRHMAQIMSIVMALFIMVPILAPAIGQILVFIGGWKMTFIALIVMSAIAVLWLHYRQDETLHDQHRRPLRLNVITSGLLEVMTTRVVMGYTIASGLVFGAFIGYLGSAQQIFLVTFGIGDWFVAYFALASASIGLASLVNAKLVMKFGMRKLTSTSIVSVALLSFVFWYVVSSYQGVPPIGVFVCWQLLAFFFVGIVFGNLNALSLEPLGHMAGIGAAFIGSISFLISLPLAWIIGNRFDGTVIPLIAGFAILSFMAWLVMMWTNYRL